MAIKPLTEQELKACKLSKVMRAALLFSSGTLGNLYGDGNRHDKTFPALKERGLAEFVVSNPEDRSRHGWILTDKGMQARTSLRMGMDR